MDLIGYEMVGPRSAAGATATQRYTVPPTRVRTLADVAYQTQTSVEQLAGLNGLAVGASVQPGQTLLVRGRP
jgi:LysM domain